jgi:alpha-glucosidase/alpha-D-xyloside xylohydrolase
MMRALWLHHPDDAAAVARGDEFLWGRDILVAPVVQPGATTRRLYLPRGTWIDFWTNEPVDGGREIDRPVDLATMPLYVRAGAVLPIGPVRQYVDQPAAEPTSLVIYPGASGLSSLYEDDGRTFRYRQGAMMRVNIDWQNQSRTLALRLAQGSQMLPPVPRQFSVRLAGPSDSRLVTFTGQPLTIRLP